MDARQLALKAAVQKRGIEYLCHFTKCENLENIKKYGLLRRSELERRNIAYSHNDDIRLDGKNAICLSVTFPNYKMFYKYRQQPPKEDWAVLILKPDIIWKKRCAFCQTNAASASVSDIPIEQLITVDAFENMFYEPSGGDNRQARGLENCDTTDPQAEILCFDKIEPSYILDLGNDSFFAPRSDYEYWQKRSEILSIDGCDFVLRQ